MEKYYLKSIIGEIAKGIDDLIEAKVICKERKVLLYGLDRYSFAMRTILSNKGFHNIEGYVSDDETTVLSFNFDIKNFSCKFLNGSSELISVNTINDRLASFDNNVLILIASKSYAVEKEKLEYLGYQEDVHFYKVYDFVDKELDNLFNGKVEMTLQEMHDAEKEVLSYVDALCSKHHLRYWVCGGTLLGTIRHKGFIPWDDDIDIFMPWKDYLKFIEVFEENEKYSMLGMGTNDTNEFCDIFAKVVDKQTIVNEDIGTVRKVSQLWIDVFPLVGLPEDAEARHLFFMEYQETNRLIWQEFYTTNGDLKVFSKWYEKQRAFLESYDFDNAKYVGVLGTAYGERDCTSRKVYDETLRMPFEDIYVNVPKGYQEYLDNLYGKDWGMLPEESKRKSHHQVAAYWMQRKK